MEVPVKESVPFLFLLRWNGGGNYRFLFSELAGVGVVLSGPDHPARSRPDVVFSRWFREKVKKRLDDFFKEGKSTSSIERRKPLPQSALALCSDSSCPLVT